MPAVVDLPYCIQCGAAPKRRRQAACAYCGAVLPWELWDELSKHRVEVTPIQESALDAAISGDRRRPSRRRSRARWRIRRIRRMRQRQNQRQHELQLQNEAANKVLVWLLLGLALFGQAWFFVQQHPVIGLIAGLGVALLASFAIHVWRVRRLERSVRKRRAIRRHGRTRIAASVLAISAPELTPGTRSHWTRIVTLYVNRGHQRVLLADADIELRAGDTGVASVVGNELVGFHVQQNLAERVAG